QGLDRAATTVDVQRGDAVDEDDVRPGGPLERATVVLAPTGPRDRGAIRVGRIGGGQQMDRPLGRVTPRFSRGSQAFDRARERELRRSEPIDEVAAPDPSRLLEGAQDRVN